MTADPGYRLAEGSPIEYHQKTMGRSIVSTFSRKSGSLSLGVHVIVLFGLSLAATTYPLIADIDPWHGHMVVGGSNRADQIVALLDHRHLHPGEHPDPGLEMADDPVILSIAEQVMLSTLASFTSAAAIVPAFTFPVLVMFLAFLAIWLMPLDFKLASLPPPSPPPRKFS